MKTYKRVTYTSREIESVTCDICKIKYRPEWGAKGSEVKRTAVEMHTGNEWPDDVMIDSVTYDICPKCFTEVLMPWLAEQGAEPTRYEA